MTQPDCTAIDVASLEVGSESASGVAYASLRATKDIEDPQAFPDHCLYFRVWGRRAWSVVNRRLLDRLGETALAGDDHVVTLADETVEVNADAPLGVDVEESDEVGAGGSQRSGPRTRDPFRLLAGLGLLAVPAVVLTGDASPSELAERGGGRHRAARDDLPLGGHRPVAPGLVRPRPPVSVGARP